MKKLPPERALAAILVTGEVDARSKITLR